MTASSTTALLVDGVTLAAATYALLGVGWLIARVLPGATQTRGQLTGIPSVAVIGVALLVTILVVEQAVSVIPTQPTFTEVCGGGCGGSPFGLLTVALLVPAFAVLIMSHVKRDPGAGEEGDE